MKRILFVFLVTGICGEVAAYDLPGNCPHKPVDEESAIALASTWFEKGQGHVDSKEYDKAVEAFACSLRMVEHKATLFNGARAAILAGSYETAIEMGIRIVEIVEDESTKEEARDLIEEAREAMPEEEPEPQVEPEEPENPRPAERPEEVVTPTEPTEEEEEGEGKSSLWKAGVATAVIGGAGLVLGGVFQGLAGSAQKTTGETDDYSKYAAAKDDIEKFQTGATVSFIAGGVLLGTGISMILVDKKSGKEDISVLPTGTGLIVKGSF